MWNCINNSNKYKLNIYLIQINFNTHKRTLKKGIRKCVCLCVSSTHIFVCNSFCPWMCLICEFCSNCIWPKLKVGTTKAREEGYVEKGNEGLLSVCDYIQEFAPIKRWHNCGGEIC